MYLYPARLAKYVIILFMYLYPAAVWKVACNVFYKSHLKMRRFLSKILRLPFQTQLLLSTTYLNGKKRHHNSGGPGIPLNFFEGWGQEPGEVLRNNAKQAFT